MDQYYPPVSFTAQEVFSYAFAVSVGLLCLLGFALREETKKKLQ